MTRILPQPTPETEGFWEGCRRGELRLQRCTACRKSYFPPRPFCPFCLAAEVSTYAASGDAVLWSYVINHRPRPDMGDQPYAIAIVQLAEGPRMMSNIVNCPQTPEALQLDMPLRVVFERQTDAITLPMFEPGKSA